jgi:microcompartment protein CcmL/EutN
MASSLGIIETEGLVAAIEAADSAVKAANVELIGYEHARGRGLSAVKVSGDVGAVKAAVEAGRAAAAVLVGEDKVFTLVIPRPATDLELMIDNGDTVGLQNVRNAAPPASVSAPAPEGSASAPAQKKTAPAPEGSASAPAQKKTAPAPDQPAPAPAQKKAAPAQKKAASASAQKKAAPTPSQKQTPSVKPEK